MRVSFIFCSLIIFGQLGVSQVSNDAMVIIGTIVDSKGIELEGVTVRIKNQPTKTNSHGQYEFPLKSLFENIQENIQVTVVYEGYKTIQDTLLQTNIKNNEIELPKIIMKESLISIRGRVFEENDPNIPILDSISVEILTEGGILKTNSSNGFFFISIPRPRYSNSVCLG